MHNQCPREVLSFLWDLFKYSDNQANKVKGGGGGGRGREGGMVKDLHTNVYTYTCTTSLSCTCIYMYMYMIKNLNSILLHSICSTYEYAI